MKRILAQTLAYLRRREYFTVCDHWGASVAHADILQAAVRHHAVEGIHVFTPARVPVSAVGDALQELRDAWPGREILQKRLSDLPELLKSNEYIFVCDVGDFWRTAQLRSAIERAPLVICGFVHAIGGPNTFDQYACSLLLGEEFDSLVVSSSAGELAITAALSGVSGLVRSRLKMKHTPSIRVARVPFAVDTEFLCPGDASKARAELSLPLSADIVLFLGRLTRKFKADLEPLLVAFARACHGRPSALLLIAGKDTEAYGQELRELASSLTIADRLRFIPNFPFALKPIVYQASDVFISPADNIQETFGLSLLEAMACGLPCLASDWSGYRDIVAHGETGFLLPTFWDSELANSVSMVASLNSYSDCARSLAGGTIVDVGVMEQRLRELLDSRELRKRMGASGLRRVRKYFSWSTIIQRLVQLWDDQFDILAQQRERLAGPLDFDSIFRHFASGVLHDGIRLRAFAGHSMSAGRRDLRRRRLPPGVDPMEAARIVDECTRAARPLETLRGPGNASASTALWLWKEGYLLLDA